MSFNMKKLKKDKRVKIIGILVFVVLLFVAVQQGGFLQTMYESSDYGDIELYNGRTGSEISSSTTLKVVDGDTIEAWLKDDPDNSRYPASEDFTATLYRGSSVVEVGERTKDGFSYMWTFDLEACPQGVADYFIRFFASLGQGNVIQGDSGTFAVSNAEAATYDDPVLIEKPDSSQAFVVGDGAQLKWVFEYDGPCRGYTMVSGIEKQSQIFGVSSGERQYIYSVDTTVEVVKNIVFHLVPDNTDITPLVSDTVTVTIGLASSYDDVVITGSPDVIAYVLDDEASLTWTFTYDGTCDAFVIVDGVEIDRKSYSATITVKTFTYELDTSEETSYDIIFKVVPDTAINLPTQTSAVEFTVYEESDLPTTTTTTTPPPDDETEYTNILIIAGAAVAGIIVIIFIRKKTSTGY